MRFALGWFLLILMIIEQFFYLLKFDYPYKYGIRLKKFKIHFTDLDLFVNNMMNYVSVYRKENGREAFIFYRYPMFTVGIQVIIGHAIFDGESILVIRCGWFMASFIVYIAYAFLEIFLSNPLISLVCLSWLSLSLWLLVASFLKRVKKWLTADV
ncbi:MAG: hypothetical protein AB9873_15655 [Syntrophobacteraceae bacterium]